MHSKTTKIAIATIIVTTALAVGVERLARPRGDQTHAFSAEIRTNMALDLDPKAAIPLRQAQPEDFDVTWDGENGGTLRIMPDSALRLAAAPRLDEQWSEAILWAHSILEQLPESTATSVSARDSRFAAILTSEGNLAVVQIGDYDQNRARLQWQVEDATPPGYGPVQVAKLSCLDPQDPSARPSAIDFDTGRTVVVPSEVLNMPPDDSLGWMKQNGIDAIALWADGTGSLLGVGLVLETLEPGLWVAASALNIRDLMASKAHQARDPILFREGQYQFVHPFKTREGGAGMLQMQAVDRIGQTVQFRYRMVQEGPSAAVAGEPQEDADLVRIARSHYEYLNELGKSLLMYGAENEDRLPQSLEEVRERLSDEQYQWIVQNVEYLGAGRTFAEAPSLILAYDRTLQAEGKGTNVLFLDTHIDFLSPRQLEEHGLPTGE